MIVLRVVLTLVFSFAFLAPSFAADPLSYSLTLSPTGDPTVDSAVLGSSQLASLRTKAPAGPFALVARARQDLLRLTTAVQSFGYYASHLSATINTKSTDDPSLLADLDALPTGAHANVIITMDKGPLFHLRHITLEGTLPAKASAAFTLQPGAPAVAATVLAACASLLSALQEQGYALATVDPPVATLIPAEHALDITLHVVSGPRVDLGPIAITGLSRLNSSYVRRRLLIHQGQLYQPSKIAAAREDLSGTGVLSGLRITAAQKLDASGQLPLALDVTERALHSVSLNIVYSTDLGGSAGATWSHHDLFGNAEQLNLTAELTGAGGTSNQGVGYLIKAQFLKPDFLKRDQTFEFNLQGLKQNLQSYDQTALIAGTALRRKLSVEWTLSIGLTGTEERILQEEITRDYTLIALPLSAQVDSTHVASPLDDPRHGIRATLAATPTESFDGHSATFVILQAQAATYFDLHQLDLAPAGSTVIAVRGLAGSAQGATDFQLPPDQRFYGGGSATVRGYRYQSIGPQFSNHDPIGGTSIDAATIELRQRLWGNFGAAAFIDAGQVAESSAPFQGHLQEGGGIGGRYYTPIGPIRVDVAVPITNNPHGDAFELYLGLGQAF